MIQKKAFWLILLSYAGLAQTYHISVDQQSLNSYEKMVHLTINLEPQEMILEQTMSISLDSPHAKLGSILYASSPQHKYIDQFSDTKQVFENSLKVNIPVQLSTEAKSLDAHLHVSFLTLPSSTMHEEIYPLSFKNDTTSTINLAQASDDHHQAVKSYSTRTTSKQSLTQSLQNMVQNSTNFWLRLFMAMLLGLLLSLTPCIYPMIPITIGVLHNQPGKRSVIRNFLGAMSYAFGLSTTFACLGLLAAFAGASFGSLLSQPIFVVCMILFIGYMSLTMIGILELRLPSFLQRGVNLNKSLGPIFSAYLFGLISGSVASPCVSPGLALLLTIVATTGNIFGGFLLLFAFGIGLSIPLIIIGTFSSSMDLMPQAGRWMIEVKKILGFVMLATCLYYASNIVSPAILQWLIVAYFGFMGIYYIKNIPKAITESESTFRSFVGIASLALAVVMIIKAFDVTSQKISAPAQQGVIWADTYETAKSTALAENKYIVLDFWAHHCTICKAIDKKLFQQDVVYKSLKDRFVFVKVDCTTNSNAESNMLKQEFQVFAQPAILIINPTNNTVLKKWSSEPYSMTPELFIDTMKKI